MIPCGVLQVSNSPETSEDLRQSLLKAAFGIMGSGGLGSLPHPSRRAFIDAMQAILDAGVRLDEATKVLAEALPRDFLCLSGATRAFLISSEGLRIDEADLPSDAMEYLSLVVFLRAEMDLGNLPYRDFAEMAHAAQEGRSRAEGLTQTDRLKLVQERIEPELRRLWPSDEARVELEVKRLLAE